MSACPMRMAEAGRKTLPIFADGGARRAAVADTLMVALLTSVKTLRDSAFGGKGSTPVPPETLFVPAPRGGINYATSRDAAMQSPILLSEARAFLEAHFDEPVILAQLTELSALSVPRFASFVPATIGLITIPVFTRLANPACANFVTRRAARFEGRRRSRIFRSKPSCAPLQAVLRHDPNCVLKRARSKVAALPGNTRAGSGRTLDAVARARLPLPVENL